MFISRTVNSWRRPAGRRLPTILFFAVLVSTNAIAYDWSNDYGIYLTAERDDNFRLTEDDPVETSSSSLTLATELRGASEISTLRMGASANGTAYSEESIEDSESYDLFLESKRRGERWFGSFDLFLNLEPTTQTELLDTGRRTDGERESISIAPGFSYQLDETKSIFVNLGFNDVSYDTVSLIGYRDNSVSAGWTNRYSEKREISINGRVSEYEPEIGDSTTISSLNLGFGISTSEATRFDLRFGYANADRPEGSDSNGDSSVEFRHRLDERNNFTLFLGNGYAESGAGEVRYQTNLSLTWDHALSERAQFQLTSQGLSNDDRDYIEIVAGSSYQLTREVSLAANYRYRKQQTEFEDADSNSVYFSISYSPVSEFNHSL